MRSENGGCWPWLGATDNNGYGVFNIGEQRTDRAHRIAWELLRGAIQKGLVIDHLCRIRRCVNPDHMELVSRGENIKRGIGRTGSQKTYCLRGHLLAETRNRFGACVLCQRIRGRRAYRDGHR